jgi:hypothetical protein
VGADEGLDCRVRARLRQRCERRRGLDSVWTSVDKYKNAKDAKRALDFWKASDAQFGSLNSAGLSVRNVLVRVPAVGSARFGYLTSYRASNIAPVSTLDEVFTDGSYLFHVNVAAGTGAQVKAFAPKLAKKLDARLKLALDGRLRAKPVELPAKPKAGPPAGGPGHRRRRAGCLLERLDRPRAFVMFSRGRFAETLQLASESEVKASAVTSVAQAAANKIDSTLGG